MKACVAFNDDMYNLDFCLRYNLFLLIINYLCDNSYYHICLRYIYIIWLRKKDNNRYKHLKHSIHGGDILFLIAATNYAAHLFRVGVSHRIILSTFIGRWKTAKRKAYRALHAKSEYM